MKKHLIHCLAILLLSPDMSSASVYWLMNTRSDCTDDKNKSVCGILQSGDGLGQSSYSDTTLKCPPLSGFGSRSNQTDHLPVYAPAVSRFLNSGTIFDSIGLPPVGTGFYVFVYDELNEGWSYQGVQTLTYNSPIKIDKCEIALPNCVHEYEFHCDAPTPVEKPPLYGGGSCEGQSSPAEVCGGDENVVWDNKANCEYHCQGCDNSINEMRAFCQPGTLASYGAATDCNYYCDCAKGTSERNQTCPMGANVDPQSCKYACKPCVQKEIECENTCQNTVGQDPVENACQETVLGTPYDATCTCPGGGTGPTGDTGEDCPYCDLLPLIKEDTGAIKDGTASLLEKSDIIKNNTDTLLEGQQDVVNLLGQLYDVTQTHIVNNDRMLSEILAAIESPQSTEIDLSPVVNAIHGLHSYFDALNADLDGIKIKLNTVNSALYDENNTPYLSSILAEMRRISKGLLETESGAQPGSLVNKMSGAIYLDEENNWVFRTDIVVPELENGTSIWDWLLAAVNTFSSGMNALSSLMNAYYAGDTPASPVYSDLDLSELGLHNDPAYQAAQALSQLDVAAAASSAASRYSALPRPTISLLNPNPCVVSSSSGLSICFNTDVWQSLYLQLKLWGYFFAHLTSFVLVYRARTGISPASSSDDE